MNRNMYSRVFAAVTLLLVLAAVLTASVPTAIATDPPVSLGRWVNYDAGTSNFPSGFTITAIAVDGQERLWIGTAGGGIAVHDGVFWTRYTTTDGLVSNDVLGLAARGDSVWIGTPSGVSVFNAATDAWTTYTTSSGLPSNRVNAIAFRGAPFLVQMFATSAGLAECQPFFPSGLVCDVHTTGNSDLASNSVKDVAVAQNGTRWIVTAGGVNRISGSTWTTYTNSNTPGCGVIESATRVAVDNQGGRVWFGTDRSTIVNGNPGLGACVFDTASETWRRFHSGNSGLADDTVKDLAVDGEGRVWIATDPHDAGDPGGVYVCTWVNDDCYWQSYTTADGLSSNQVHAVGASLDRVWFGTQDAGLSSFALHWRLFNEPVRVLAGQAGRLWVGSDNGLKRFDGTSWTTELSDLEVRTILPLVMDDVWIGTDGDGAHHWDGSTWQSFDTGNSGLASNSVLALVRDATGRFWMGTDDAGVSVYDPAAESWTTFNTSNSPLAGNHVESLVVDAQDAVWIGTDDGLSRYTGTAWETHTTADGLPHDTASAQAVDTLGGVWAATVAGAARWDGSSWTTFTTADGLPSDVVRSLSVDPAGKVWLGTLAGAAVYDGAEWTIYRARNSGLTNERVQALATDADGGVWFGASGFFAGPVLVEGGVFVRGTFAEPLGQPAPTISDFSPVSGPVDTVVTVNGTNFDPRGPAYNTVEFRAKGFDHWVQATVLSASGTTITANAPSQAIQGPIRVRTAAGTATSNSDFNPSPAISAINPTSGVVGAPVDIYGTNLDGPTFDEVRFGTSEWNSLAVISQTHDHVRAHVPEDATTGDLQVRTASGTATSPTPFTVGEAGLKIFDWDVHQGLPSYPLVAGKSTVVRVFVGTDDPDGLCAYVDRAVLQVLASDSDTPKGYIVNLDNGGVPNDGWFCNTEQQFANDGSIDFVIPGEDLPANQYLLGVGLSARFVNLASRELGRYVFTTTGDLRMHISPPGLGAWTPAAWDLFDRQLTALSRAYPVRDGAGPLGSENGFQYVLNTSYRVCDGTETDYCGEGFLWDYWQENSAGQERACVGWNQLKNAQDDGSSITWDLGTVKEGDGGSQTFLVRLRPGTSLPTDPTDLITATVQPADLGLTVSAMTTFSSNCGSFTPGDVVQFRLRYVNNSGEDVEGTLQADYDESRVTAYGPGGMILGSGSDFATWTAPGQFFLPEGSRGKKFDEPLDVDYNGLIDTDDLVNFVAEFEDWDAAAGNFTVSTDLSQLEPLELIRNFRDANGNGKPDDGESFAPFLRKETTVYDVIETIPLAYMNDYNQGLVSPAEFSSWWLWGGLDPFGFKGIEGQASQPGIDSWVKLKGNTGILHELGHNIGHVEKDSPNNNGGAHSMNKTIPGIPAGYDIVARRVLTSANQLSIMWPNVQSPVEDAFFEPFEYYRTFTFFRDRAATQATLARKTASNGRSFAIIGSVTKDGELDIATSHVAEGLAPTPADETSAYSLRFLTGNQVLGEHRFRVDFSLPHPEFGETEKNRTGFYVVQPFPAGTTAVEIRHDANTLWRQEVSATPPQVLLSTPNGGGSYGSSDALSITWQGEDADGDPLTYAVRYSADGGASWQTLSPAARGNQLEVPLASLPGGDDVLVEVEASDGFHTASDRSDASFSVGKKSPLWAGIAVPAKGAEFVQSQRVSLAGSGFDLEDGVLAGDSLTWTSNRDGLLGVGAMISDTLTVGEHVITLAATDSNGLTVSTAFSLTVQADFDGDGLADEYEQGQSVLDWWNPDDAGADPDQDGLTNRGEAAWGTDLTNPDSDGDGILDGAEVAGGSSPSDPAGQPEPPRLLVSSTELSFVASADGPNPEPQGVLLISSTPEELAWTAEADVAWLHLEPASGTTPGEVAVSVDVTGLPPGDHEGRVTFRVGDSERAMPVHLEVVGPTSTPTPTPTATPTPAATSAVTPTPTPAATPTPEVHIYLPLLMRSAP